MQIREVVRFKENCKHVCSSLKRCLFIIKDFEYGKEIPYLFKRKAIIECFYNPSFKLTHKTWSTKATINYRKNELKGSIYTVDMDVLTGD